MPKHKRPKRITPKKKKKKQRKATIVETSDGEQWYKIQAVLACREIKKTGEYQYLLQWEGWDDPTWEPEECLCSSVMREAEQLRVLEEEKALSRAEKDDTSEDADSHDNRKRPGSDLFENEEKEDDVDNGPWDWSDAGQLKYRDIERIHVDDPTAPQRVTDARLSGVPVCLVGHKGWAQFAKPWLEPISVFGSSRPRRSREQPKADDLLDLSIPHRLNVEKMEEDIGSEPVPIRRKRDGYDQDPNKKKILLKSFLKNCWSQNDLQQGAASGKAGLYLHQWQFPMSETAVSKLCGPGKNTLLPNGILGDDLLRYWHEQSRYMGDNPYQYIFMGREGTMSKLHCDNGGLMITIAPIIGKKEVLLVHRADGPTSLYHLAANLEQPDLDHFPLMFTARVWKSILKPGEILIMPQGTYHQCRNVTPCLSYHRFVLDETNLKPFVESFFDCDATEIDHEGIIWNASFELHTLVDTYADNVRSEWQQTGKEYCLEEIPTRIVRAVHTLRSLRNISKEIASRLRQKKDPECVSWDKVVDDIDVSIHNFRHRYYHKMPRQSTRKLARRNKGSLTIAALGDLNDEDGSDGEASSIDKLVLQLRRATSLEREEEYTVISDSVNLQVGDNVTAKVHGKKIQGEITEIREQMNAAFIEYDDFDLFQSEFRPFDDLRLKVAGECNVVIRPDKLQEGKIVYWSDKGEPYRARVRSCRRGTFYLVSLKLSNGRYKVDRWLSRDSLLSKTSVAFNDSDSEDADTPSLAKSPETEESLYN
jgi:hypothetical protein